ncbi:hypothetical protein B0H16DRAFT_1761969 [Mycena metata]|uniref:DUF6532 domain-containing protein n=1 Tax=Mycena metata TaxID=1033252 RepID=A0AAD7IAN3_9AGAR|nr:hypothetical protein B0H16DRAFT_1761969 [Mycena metata]
MANQSTLRSTASTSGSSRAHTATSTSGSSRAHTGAAAGNAKSQARQAPLQDDLEDRDRARTTAGNARTKTRQPQAQDDYEDSDDDHDYYAPAAQDFLDENMDDEEEEIDDEEDEDQEPARGRTRRPSEKQAQNFEEQQAAKVRKQQKALKADKAAKKKAGIVEQDTRGPIQDDVFTSRTVTTTRPTATKNLAQRNNHVPPAPKFPSADWHISKAALDRHATASTNKHQDDRRAHHPPAAQQTFRGMSVSPARENVREPLRNINGGIVPDRVNLHLPPAHSHSPKSHRQPTTPRSRSRSPAAGEKHHRSSSMDSDDMRPTQTVKTRTSGGRPRAKDLDEVSKEYIGFAIRRYRGYISTTGIYPEPTTNRELIDRAWGDACVEFGKQLLLTPTIYKLIACRGPQMRGEMKTKTRPLTETMYGFRSGNDKKTIAFNRKLAEDLKENALFTMKDVKAKKACNAIWFANHRDEGPTSPDLFNPFTREGLAGLLTVIENTIDEYLTGIRTDVPFTANDYRSVYQTHLRALKEFEEHTAKYKLLNTILVRMHNVARFHSGAQPITEASTAVLPKNLLDAALQEWEDDSSTETDGEHGDDDASI